MEGEKQQKIMRNLILGVFRLSKQRSKAFQRSKTLVFTHQIGF